jgi:hypothetical protein
VGGAVIDAQGPGAPADIDAERLPGEGLLEDPLAQIAGEKKAVRPARPERGEKPQLGDADVLRLVHNGKVERRMVTLRKPGSETAEQAGGGDQAPVVQAGADAIEDRPEADPLRLRQARLTAQPPDVPVRLPALQLPGVNDRLPLREQETGIKFHAGNLPCRFRQELPDHGVGGDPRTAEVHLIPMLFFCFPRSNSI